MTAATKKFNNAWSPGRVFNDATSHYFKFNKQSIQQFFGVNGPYSRLEGVPNWVEPCMEHDRLEYRFVFLDDENKKTGDWPLFIRFQAKPNIHVMELPEGGKGKAVAFWNYEYQNAELTAFSDDPMKSIIVDESGLVHAIPVRMSSPFGHGHTHCQFRLSVGNHGEVPMTPYVVLAFYMWIESDSEDAMLVRQYLHKMGWKFDAETD